MPAKGAAPRSPPLRGRQAEAAVHDIAIMDAAFTTLTSNPRATMAEIAELAGVGVASLYRRYPTRQELAHQLCLRAMDSISAAADACRLQLKDPATEPWPEFLGFITAAIAAGAGAMRALAGTFDAGPDLSRAAAQMNKAIQQVVRLAQRRGAVREDVTAADITQFFEMLRAIRAGTPQRSDELRQRYLLLFSGALRTVPVRHELTVAAPRWQEVSATWNKPAATAPGAWPT
ncbi:MAG: TetR/AcrR family transcriptional regulator [Jatrophihabitans sp.]